MFLRVEDSEAQLARSQENKYSSELRTRRLDRHKAGRISILLSQGLEGSTGMELGEYVFHRGLGGSTGTKLREYTISYCIKTNINHRIFNRRLQRPFN